MLEIVGVVALVAYAVGTLIAGFVAEEKGRSRTTWIFCALLATPLIALVALAALPYDRRAAVAPNRPPDVDEAREQRAEFWTRWRANVGKDRPRS